MYRYRVDVVDLGCTGSASGEADLASVAVALEHFCSHATPLSAIRIAHVYACPAMRYHNPPRLAAPAMPYPTSPSRAETDHD